LIYFNIVCQELAIYIVFLYNDVSVLWHSI